MLQLAQQLLSLLSEKKEHNILYKNFCTTETQLFKVKAQKQHCNQKMLSTILSNTL